MATERTGARRLLILVCFWLASILIGHPPAVRGNGVLRAMPAAVSLTLAPGQQVVTSIQVSNGGEQTVTPLIYEAAAVSSPARSTANMSPIRVPLPQQAQRIDPQLAQSARGAQPRGFTVYLSDQADLAGAYRITDWRARGQYVYDLLHTHAETSQRGVRAVLQARGVAFQPLWIVNAIVVQGSYADAQAVAGLAEVALVRGQRQAALPLTDPRSVPAAYRPFCSPEQPENPVCWNIRTIGADRVWNEFGITGAGVVVASNDSGVMLEHEALAAQYRGYRGPGVYEHTYNWYDPRGINPAPVDDNGHGTHTTSTMVGRGSADLPAVGVAPGAQWIAAQGCGVQSCDEVDLIRAAQWLLAPLDAKGQNPRPDLRPMIVNNSWAGPGGDDWYAGYITAWRAAGMFPVFAAGNSPVGEQAICGSVSSPADDGNVVAVGASEASGQIAPFSLLGPAVMGHTKPDLVAPGTYASGQFGILGAYRGAPDSYRTLQGTSMAAPHVSGVVALMWSANPALIGDYDATLA
ncbi:MAG TPA: S8 family serine peptidase, partial [Roseiflexaceae bacterium]|nr:S8 family serine peptidase [Roseiflexaceae bacterium]